MAADSRASDDGLHLTSCKKIFRLKNGALLGTAGDDDDRAVRAMLSKATPRKMPSREALAALRCDFLGLMVFPKGQTFIIKIERKEYDHEGEWIGEVSSITDGIVAVGHGANFAYGALEHGATPVNAVRVTCRRDTTCALPVQWETLNGAEAVAGDEQTRASAQSKAAEYAGIGSARPNARQRKVRSAR